MACRSSLVAKQLIRVLTLQINAQWCCPLTTLHIAGDQNMMTNIPSWLFGSAPNWHFKREADLLTFFNQTFPLPLQNSWKVSQPSSAIATRVISILRIVPFKLKDCRQLPAVAKNIGTIGRPMQGLWEWTLIYRTQASQHKSGFSQDSWLESVQDSLVKESRSSIVLSAARSLALAR
jgi:hypothetical protein